MNAARSSHGTPAKRAPPAAERETGTVARVLMVLREIAAAPVPLAMKELADRLNLPLSTMHRLLELLAREDMVEREAATRTFRPGPAFFRMASHVVGRMPIRALAAPFLQAAVQAVDESAYLCLLDARAWRVQFARAAESTHLLDYRVPLDTPLRLTTGASGLSILAWLEVERAQEIVAAEVARGELSKAEAQRVLAALPPIRTRGYAHTFGQRIPGAVGIFAPVFEASGAVCGSLGFTVPELRYAKAAHERLADTARQQAQALSRALGQAEERTKAAR